MTEDLYKDDPEFHEWCKTTNVFLPMPRRGATHEKFAGELKENVNNLNNVGDSEV